MQKVNSIQFKIRMILTVLLSIITVFTLLNTNSLTAYAAGSGGNAEGSDSDGNVSSTDLQYGISISNQFWLAYITDESGNVKSDVVLIHNNTISADFSYIYTRPEHGSIAPSRDIIGCDWGYSFGSPTEDASGNKIIPGYGDEIKAWMLSPDPTNPAQTRVYSVVQNCWGDQMMKDFHDNQWYFVLENGLWCGVYKNETYQNAVFAGTSFGWALMQSNNGIEPAGDPQTRRFINGALPNSTKLQFAQTGLAAPASGDSRRSNVEIMSSGYGCLIIWANDPVGGYGDSTHTWDSVNHPTNEDKAPDPVEENPLTPPEDLQYTIIKSYRIRDSHDNLTDRGTYTRTQTVASILIEDEPLGDGKNYKVIGWRPSSQSKPDGLTALNWESTVPEHIRETGTEAGFTTLDTNHKYLYVLLEATEDGVADYNYNLPQSSITRRINYSTPDHALGNMTSTLNTYPFSFLIGEHTKTSCPGHTWYHSDNDSSCINYDTVYTYGNSCTCGYTHTHLTF